MTQAACKGASFIVLAHAARVIMSLPVWTCTDSVYPSWCVNPRTGADTHSEYTRFEAKVQDAVAFIDHYDAIKVFEVTGLCVLAYIHCTTSATDTTTCNADNINNIMDTYFEVLNKYSAAFKDVQRRSFCGRYCVRRCSCANERRTSIDARP